MIKTLDIIVRNKHRQECDLKNTFFIISSLEVVIMIYTPGQTSYAVTFLKVFMNMVIYQ